jgi:hypothetical protein
MQDVDQRTELICSALQVAALDGLLPAGGQKAVGSCQITRKLAVGDDIVELG